jgi:hypothetical protein
MVLVESRRPGRLCVAALILTTAILPQRLRAQSGSVNVLTQRYDNGRSGASLQETTLNVANVSTA